METQMIQEACRNSNGTISNTVCIHQRMIDDVWTRDGKRTGKVRCLESEAIFNDPHRGSK